MLVPTVTCHPRGWKVTWFPMVTCAFSGSRARGTNIVRHKFQPLRFKIWELFAGINVRYTSILIPALAKYRFNGNPGEFIIKALVWKACELF